MPRGAKAKIGDKRKAPNGYWYIKTEEGWRFQHHIVAEQKLGRRIDTATERVRFKNGDSQDMRPENIEVVTKGKASLRQRLNRIDARIEDLQRERADIVRQLDGGGTEPKIPWKEDHET